MVEPYVAEKLEQFRQEEYGRNERSGAWVRELQPEAPAGRWSRSRIGRTIAALAARLARRR
ncbi:hypothetical protein HGI30_20095 [Paenibacillus albicereus]|uniref:Uncharacterized protein n=1 Tax=Paenibacillus albicereus TaxID=2726185 RepID=A0A6H2H2G2_9BACL|nr:hypothetical protein [Paenibacillus albicereus]QJC53606.1 hypothetical protein HGI30_20095 [Paenibacillus albicereus]